MPKVGPDEVQFNYVIKKTLDKRIQGFWHGRQLPSKAEAVRQLLEKGLEAAEKEDAKAPGE